MGIFRELGIRGGKDRINEEVVYTIARSYVFLEQAISNFLSKYNLTPAKFNILLMAKHRGNGKGLPQNEISKLLLVTTSNITRMVDKLEKDNYVERLAKKGDRRVNLIKITGKGSVLLDEIWPHYETMLDNLIVSQFSDQDKRAMVNLLDRFKVEKVESES
ncbi:MAG: MarR family transcriptional regulator [Candidatus Omnitrophica bacterium]|nr:MarR family transcriptional regulator [Candidatus Omnitrophota bacterium]